VADLDAGTVWGVILVVGAVTFAIRVSFVYLFGRIDAVPSWLTRTFRFVPPAVLAALVLPSLVTLRPSVTATLGSERLVAGLVAAAVAWRTESILATIVAGMVMLWTLRFVV
jgi:branched-subunit amino acid transport protein